MVAGLTSSILLLLTLPPLDAWYIAYVALVPYALWLKQERRASLRLSAALLASLPLGLGTTHWAAMEGGGISWLRWLLLALLGSFPWLACALLSGRRGGLFVVSATLALPITWVAGEWVGQTATIWLTGFQHYTISLSQLDAPFVPQIADVGGAATISFLVAMINGFAADLLARIRQGLRSADDPIAVNVPWIVTTSVEAVPSGRWLVAGSATTAAALCGTIVYGWQQLRGNPSERTLRAAAFVADISGMREATHPRLLKALRRLRGRVDVIVFPETCGGEFLSSPYIPPNNSADGTERLADGLFLQDGSTRSRWRKLAAECAAPIILGATAHDRTATGWKRKNVACALTAAGECAGVVEKLQPVIWHEHIPAARIFGGSREAGDDPCGVAFGQGPKQWTFFVERWKDAVRVGVPICSEIGVPEVVRKAARSESGSPTDALIDIGDESSFFGTDGPLMLARLARLRAMENRRAILRCVRGGETCVIDDNGQVVASMENERWFEAMGVKEFSLPVSRRWSLYREVGPWLSATCLVAAVALWVLASRPFSFAFPGAIPGAVLHEGRIVDRH